MDFIKEIVYHSLIVIGVIYGAAALFWMLITLALKDKAYDLNWLESLCIIVATGLTAPICILINDNDFKLSYKCENFICGLFDPFRPKKRK